MQMNPKKKIITRQSKKYNEPLKPTTVFLNHIQLNMIEFLISMGYAPNRSKFIRDAIQEYFEEIKEYKKLYYALVDEYDARYVDMEILNQEGLFL